MSDDAKSIWQNPKRGFRMMWWDPIAFVAIALATWFAWGFIHVWALIAPYVLLNFFLFCNVFRVRRNYELLWGASFLGNAAIWLSYAHEPLGLMASQLLVTGILVALEVASSEYRGVFWRLLR